MKLVRLPRVPRRRAGDDPGRGFKTMKLPRFARTRARRLVESPRKLRRVVKRAQRKLTSAEWAHALKPLLPLLAELKTMLELARACARREYPGISTAKLSLIVGAIVYFLTPTDFLPDFIVAVGFTDDAAVIAWVVGSVRDELAKFKDWQAGTALPGSAHAGSLQEPPNSTAGENADAPAT